MIVQQPRLLNCNLFPSAWEELSCDLNGSVGLTVAIVFGFLRDVDEGNVTQFRVVTSHKLKLSSRCNYFFIL